MNDLATHTNAQQLRAVKTGPARRDAQIAADHGWTIDFLAPHALRLTHPDGIAIEAEYTAANNVFRGYIHDENADTLVSLGTRGNARATLRDAIKS